MNIYFYILIFSIFLIWGINRIRKAVLKRKFIRNILQKGEKFIEKIKNGDMIIYYNHHGKFCSIDFAGNSVRQPYLMDENGKEIEPFPDICWEMCPDFLITRSQVPSIAYRLMPTKVQIKHDIDGAIYYPITLQFCFRPVENDISEWNVTQIKRNYFTVEHSLMGQLILPKLPKQKIIPKRKIRLISRVKTYYLSTRELWFNIVNQN